LAWASQIAPAYMAAIRVLACQYNGALVCPVQEHYIVIPDTFLHESFSPDAFAMLRDDLQGSAFLPSDADFAGAILTWSLGTRHEPAIVVLPESAHDVVCAMRFAHDHDLPVAVQGTGHGMPVACTGGMLINTQRMRGVEIDPERRIARVEAGAKWSHVIPLAHEYGLAPLCGSSSDVGVVGYTLGGGHGWLARRHGRAAERIVAADIVTARGDLIHVSAESNPDLLDALRGGSGNFGIVTSLEVGLVPVSHVYGGAVFYSLEDARAVFGAFNTWTKDLPESITAGISIMRFPPLPMLPPPLQGAACVVVRACACEDLDAAEQIIEPMRRLTTPLMDTFGALPFSAIDAISMDPTDPMPVAGRTLMLDSLDEAQVEALLSVAGPGIESPVLMVEVRYLGNSGAYAREHGTALAAPYVVYAIGVTGAPEAHVAVSGALEGIAGALAPFASDRVLLNFLGDGDVGEHRTRAAFDAEEYLRLQQVKTTYDPGNRFRFNHNILPMRIVVDAPTSRPGMPGRLV